MKTYLLSLTLFFSLTVSAASETLTGYFQVDPSHSKVTLVDREQSISGFIEIKPNFSESKLKLESGDATFESTEITGDLQNFKARGFLHNRGETSEVTVSGNYFGIIDKEDGHRRIALKLANGECIMRVFALKPTEAATALHKEVQDIIQ